MKCNLENAIIYILDNGASIVHEHITICDLSYFSRIRKVLSKKYQVVCTHPNHRHDEIYEDIHATVAKFISLKRKIYKCGQ